MPSGLQALTGLGICISFVCMLLAIRVIEISVAYSVFVGIGAAGIRASRDCSLWRASFLAKNHAHCGVDVRDRAEICHKP